MAILKRMSSPSNIHGRAAMKAIINTEVAVNKVGIIKIQNTEPSNVKTVFGASYPVAEATPQACTFASL